MRRNLAWCAVLAVLAAFLVPSPAAGAPDEPFGIEPIAEPTQELIVREWKTMPQKLLRDAAVLETCREDRSRCTGASVALIGLIDRVKNLDFYPAFLEVDAAVNRMIAHVTDVEQWGPVDGERGAEVWTSPLDTALSGKGDCDDFVNLKFFVLWQAGVPLNRMRFVILEYLSDEEHELHITLAGKGRQDWYLLDSMPLKPARVSEVRSVLTPYDLYRPSTIAAAVEPQTR